uniref:Uncharacterized protein n=1 Tax=Plectus sambesii TaxID=2011161 RepID=A0A914XC71_9BILA
MDTGGKGTLISTSTMKHISTLCIYLLHSQAMRPPQDPAFLTRMVGIFRQLMRTTAPTPIAFLLQTKRADGGWITALKLL